MSDYDMAYQLWNDKGAIVCMQFYPIASVDWINLVVCWLKRYTTEVATYVYKRFYQCCTGEPVGCYPVYRICCQFLIDNILFSFKALLTYIACKLRIHWTAIPQTAIRKENFGQDNFGKSLEIHQIHQDFLPQNFCII